MKYEYKKINISTIEGIKQAEKLQAEGWIISSSGWDILNFYKKIKESEK